MKGDFSRNTFDPRKRYSGVLMQQGRVQVDADWNEQLEIGRYRIETEAVDVIGHCGVPKNTDGFKLTPVKPEGIGHSTDLAIAGGRIYVDGLLCELEPGRVAVTFDVAQPKQAIASTLAVDGYAFAKGQWVEMSADDVADKKLLRVEGVDAGNKTLSFDDDVTAYHGSANAAVRRVVTYLSQPDLLNPPFSVQPGGDPNAVAEIQPSTFFSLAYLHVWERHVTALDDPLIREKALGGPDTATRSKTVWQLEILPLELDGNAQFDCQTSFPEWDALVAPSSGMMNARTQPAVDPKDPCLLPPSAGYRRLENQLYRVEVQKGGTRDQATFKWSRENGSVLTTVEKVDGATITVTDLGKDDVLGFHGGDWVELVTDETELKGAPRALALIDTIDPDLREITLDASAADLATTPRVKLRRWDQKGATATPDGVAMTAGWVDLEGGIQVEFSEGTYRAGDYWLIPARTATAEIEWPPFNVPNADPQPQPPRGIRHHYCRLATLKFDDGVITVKDDCRDFFPPLTDICAEDVCFDNEVCQMPDVKTVQDAIENLCARNDLKHHNKHLHGWGIVCGLQVHCGPDSPNDPPRRHVTVRAGYALDCEGNDIIHRQDDELDILQMIAEHNQEFPNDPIVIVDGRDGEVCLVLNNAGAQKPYSLEPHDEDADSWKSILKGTIWMDFYNDCLGKLVDVFKEELKPLPGEEDLPVTPAQKRVTALFNLLIQLFNKSNGRFVYLSGEQGLDDPKTEHIILRNLYEKLRAVVQSQTFCGQFDSAPFPEYPFTKLNEPTVQPPYIPTIFGKNSHTRVRVHPSGRWAYTMGVGNLINVYDLIANEMIAEVEFPDDAAQVRDVAFSQDGKQLYAAATISNSASLFAVADINGPEFKWHIPAVSCSAVLVTLATTKNAPNRVYGVGRGKGVYELDLNNLGANMTPLFSFNATGHLVLVEQGSQTFVFATANQAGGSKFVYDRVLRFALLAKQNPPGVFNLQANQESLTGRDDIAVSVEDNTHRLYVVTDPPVTSNNKQLLVFANATTSILPGGLFDLEDNTTFRLAYNSVTEFLMVTYADRYCVRLFGPNGLVQELFFRHPVQVSPVSIAMERDPFTVDRKRVYVLNNVSRTITSIPAEQFSLPRQVDMKALADYRTAILEAFVNLFGGLLQYLKDCLCDHLLVRCPVCTPEDKLYLACIEIRGGEVYKICNFSLRKYVHSFPTVEYWLSLVPVIPLVAKAVEKFCCSILPDFFGRFKASTETGAANMVGSQSLFAASSLFQEMNFGSMLGKLFSQGQQFGGRLFKDMLLCSMNDKEESPGLTQASVVGMQVDEATRFLNSQNIGVAGVEAYDPCDSLCHLLQSLCAPKRLAEQSVVNLVVQNGTVQSVTVAGASGFGARAGGSGGDAGQTEASPFAGLVGGRAGAGDVKKELDELRREVTSSREQFEKALAERDDTIGRLKAQAEEMQATLKALAEPREEEKPGGTRAGRRRPKGDKKPG